MLIIQGDLFQINFDSIQNQHTVHDGYLGASVMLVN